MPIRIIADNIPEQILPGTTCDVDILIGERVNVLLIPLSSLSNGHVWLSRKNSLPKKVHVVLGMIDKTQAEVIGGDIQTGDRVMIH